MLVIDGGLFVCVDFHHGTPGNKRGNVQAKLKSLAAGSTVTRKFSSTERIEFAFLEKIWCEYLYQEADAYVFMDTETYEQHHINASQVADQMPFLVENARVQVTFFEGTAVSLELPGTVELVIAQTDPGLKGDSVSNVFKPATLETGHELKVPNHINIGDRVKVSTQTGEFQGRVTS